MRIAGEEAGGPRVWFRGASAHKPIRLMERKRVPRRIQSPAGFVGLDRSAAYGCSPQPSGLPEPAGRFHRGATRGEQDGIVSGSVEDANT